VFEKLIFRIIPIVTEKPTFSHDRYDYQKCFLVLKIFVVVLY